jgi:hypothetical protein
MAKYRCPICGAAHKEPPTHCRLCGQDMRDAAFVPTTPKGARVATKPRKGTLRIAVLGAVAVLAILVLALVFGFRGDDAEFVDEVQEQLPGRESTEGVGWSALTDEAGGYVVELPDARTQQFAPFVASSTGRVEQWVAPIGDETQLSVSYAPVAVPSGQDESLTVSTLADEWAASLGGDVDRRDEVDYSGSPGNVITVDGLRYDDQPASARALVVLRDGRVYVVQSLSIYPDHPQFTRVANSLRFI